MKKKNESFSELYLNSICKRLKIHNNPFKGYLKNMNYRYNDTIPLIIVQ